MAADSNRPYFPPFWNDNSKMTAFFSPILSKTANPEGVSRKLDEWKQCIQNYLQYKKKSTFTYGDIVKAFERNHRSPQCLQTVIEHMLKSSEIQEINGFINMKPTMKLKWSSWAWEIGKTPVSWTLNKFKTAVWPAAPDCLNKYIHIQILKDKAEELLASDHRGNIMQLGELLEKCGWASDQVEDAMLAIHWLVLHHKAAVENFDLNSPYKMLVKLGLVEGNDVLMDEKDLCKYRLLKSIKMVEDLISEYETRSANAREEAVTQLKKNCRSLALCQLRKKKRYEATINQQANVLNNLHELLETLNQRVANEEVFEALKTANAAMKNTFKESTLNEDSVMDVMDDIRDTMETQEEIETALSKSIVNEDIEQLEKELNDLMDEKISEDDLCKRVEKLKLPDVPDQKLMNQNLPGPETDR